MVASAYPLALAHVLIFLCICVAPWLVDAQVTRPCNRPDLTTVCAEIGREAEAQCFEYAEYGVTECVSWKTLAEQACIDTCANCSEIAFNIRGQCRFALQILQNGPAMTNFCEQTRASMDQYRCPPLVDVNDGRCDTPRADLCMRDCGNYGGCLCWEQKGTVRPPACQGFTRSDTIDAYPGITFSCDMTPLECVHYQQSSCGAYHHCTPDLCKIRQVQCIPGEDCLMFDMCDPTNGLCYFKNRPNGYNCSDGIFYTLDDYCMNGLCVGTPNLCVRYNVTCEPYSPCLRGGYCHSHSGRCTYDQLPNGVPCDDGRPYTLEDQCQDGSCIGNVVDLCIERGVVCTAPNSCFDPGTCDPTTGRCSDAVASPDPRPCDDGDPTTTEDRCIDGLCLGRLSGTEFLTLGQGECTDRESGRMARYSGDVEDEQQCMQLCREDPQCAAYSYAYPLCSIYGTVRTRAPNNREWAFQEGSTNPVAISVEKAEMTATGQRSSTCRRKGVQADTAVDYGAGSEFRINDFFEPWKVAVFLIVVLLVFFSWSIFHALQRCFCGVSVGMNSVFVDPLPKGEFFDSGTFDVHGDRLRVAADHDASGHFSMAEQPTLRSEAYAAGELAEGPETALPGEPGNLPLEVPGPEGKTLNTTDRKSVV